MVDKEGEESASCKYERRQQEIKSAKSGAPTLPSKLAKSHLDILGYVVQQPQQPGPTNVVIEESKERDYVVETEDEISTESGEESLLEQRAPQQR
uniref:Uncharacterized protein n=1 Tax=Romanomermis culicivorax TaxID=13658 RepID=A0A915JP01_ROMCU